MNSIHKTLASAFLYVAFAPFALGQTDTIKIINIKHFGAKGQVTGGVASGINKAKMLRTDSAGNIYITGTHIDTVDWAGVKSMAPFPNGSVRNAFFLTSFKPDLSPRWARADGAVSTFFRDGGFNLALDNRGTLYSAGGGGNAPSFMGTTGVVNAVLGAVNTQNGTPIFARSFSAVAPQIRLITAVVADNQNAVYVAGFNANGGSGLDLGSGVIIKVNATTGQTIWTKDYDQSNIGKHEWYISDMVMQASRLFVAVKADSRNVGTTPVFQTNILELDPATGDVIKVFDTKEFGYIPGRLVAGPDGLLYLHTALSINATNLELADGDTVVALNNEQIVAAYSLDGKRQKVYRTYNTSALTESGLCIAGNRVVLGTTVSSFPTLSPLGTLAPLGFNDILIQTWDIASAQLKAQALYGAADDDKISGIGLLPNGDIAMAGYFQGTVPFGTTTLRSTGLSDIWVAIASVSSCTIPATPAVSASGTTQLCPGDSVTLSFTSNAGPRNYAFAALAGAMVPGYKDGQDTSARFAQPSSLTVDAGGNVFVTDKGNFRVRKVGPAGAVITLAGTSSAGFVNGPGGQAQFQNPTGIVVDKAGNVYVADGINARIRKITPAGQVSTYAGNGQQGYADGLAATARFNEPQGLAIDATGTIYVADLGGHRIRKITPTGIVTTLAGSGTAGFTNGNGTNASFNAPMGLAVDPAGNVYVADKTNNRIRKISRTGLVSTVAGLATAGYRDGPATQAQFNGPTSVAVSTNGTLYVTDASNSRLRAISPAGAVTTYLGITGFASGNSAPPDTNFTSPQGVATDSAGNIYVADFSGNRILKISPPPAPPAILWSSGASTPSIVVKTAGSYSVQLISQACTSATSTPIVVTTTPALIPSPISATLSNLCPGQSTTLSITTDAANQVNWSTTSTTQSINTSTPGTYKVTVNTRCQVFSDSVVISEGSVPVFADISTDTICRGSSINKTLNLLNGGAVTVTANGGATQGRPTINAEPTSLTITSAEPLTTFTSFPFTLSTTSADGCPATASYTVAIRPSVADVLTATNTATLCPTGQAVLDLTALPANISLALSANNPAGITQTSARVFTVKDLGLPEGVRQYQIAASAPASCPGIVKYDVTVQDLPEKCAQLLIPNVATPDAASGKNTRFTLGGIASGTASVTIFNRWGRQVFTSSAYANTWPEADTPAGLYYYALDAPTRNLAGVKGWVEVVRD